jgi:hypothetical protein
VVLRAVPDSLGVRPQCQELSLTTRPTRPYLLQTGDSAQNPSMSDIAILGRRAKPA